MRSQDIAAGIQAAVDKAQRGKLDAAIGDLEQLRQQSILTKDNQILGKIYYTLASIYRQKGHYKKAKIYMRQASEAVAEINDVEIEIHIAANSALIFNSLGNKEKALEHINKAITKANTHEVTEMMLKLYNMKFWIYYSQKDYENADKILQKIKQFKSYPNYAKFAEALMEKSKPRIANKVKAQKLLRNAIDTISDLEAKMILSEHLIHLLLEEYAMYETKEVMGEIEEKMNYLNDLAVKNHATRVHVVVLNLRAKFAIIQKDWNYAIELLNKAMQIVKSNKDELLKKEIAFHFNELEHEILSLDKVLLSNPQIHQYSQQNSALNYMTQVLNQLQNIESEELNNAAK